MSRGFLREASPLSLPAALARLAPAIHRSASREKPRNFIIALPTTMDGGD